MESPEGQRVRHEAYKIARCIPELDCGYGLPECSKPRPNCGKCVVDRILSIPDILVKADDQSLPFIPPTHLVPFKGYNIQQDMLKTGFRKVIL